MRLEAMGLSTQASQRPCSTFGFIFPSSGKTSEEWAELGVAKRWDLHFVKPTLLQMVNRLEGARKDARGPMRR